MDLKNDIEKLAKEIESCQAILNAIGDTSRQHLMLEMMQMEGCSGARVNDIAKKCNLSRPAVSHHLQILKKVGIMKMRKEGTKNYYYFDADMESFNQLISMLIHAKKIMEHLPDRSGNEE